MKLYVTDIDGTLIQDIYGLSKRDQLRLRRVIDSGFPLTFATGRVIPSALRALGHPTFKLPQIGHGGAVTMDVQGKVLRQVGMTGQDVAQTLDYFVQSGLGLTVVLAPEHDHGRLWWKPEGFYGMDLFIESRSWDPSFRALDLSEDLSQLSVVSMSCCGSQALMDQTAQWIQTQSTLDLEIVHDPYLKDVKVGFVHQRGSSKGAAVQALAADLGISKEDICVFGDGMNDVSLFQAAGLCIAPAGSCNEIVAMAHQQLGPQETVLDYLEAEAKKLKFLSD